jgi:hypothetical protein
MKTNQMCTNIFSKKAPQPTSAAPLSNKFDFTR